MRSFLAAAALASLASTAEAATLYRAMFVRAAPGRLLDVIALYKERMLVHETAGDEPPLWVRHSQGDHWDLMFLFPMESFTEFYSKERVARRASAAQELGLPAPAEFRQMVRERMSWHEEVFVDGPPMGDLRKAFEGAGLFPHRGVPGASRQAGRAQARARYGEHLSREDWPSQELHLHPRGGGGLGSLHHRGLSGSQHYAESSDVPREKLEAAARAAGFMGVDAIGAFLRTLISTHHDTLAVPVK
jgi:hypothetical protein